MIDGSPPQKLSFRLGHDGLPVDGNAVPWLVDAPAFLRLRALATRLRQPMTRAVVAAAPGHDVTYDLSVRPDRTGIDVTGSLIDARGTSAPRAPADVAGRLAGDAQTTVIARWSCDARIRLTAIDWSTPVTLLEPSRLLGRPLSTVFLLRPDREGAFPILSALADGTSFLGQAATIDHDVLRDDDAKVMLSGLPIIADGVFAGFQGQADRADQGEPVDGRAWRKSETDARAESIRVGDDLLHRQFDAALRAPLNRIAAGADSMAAGVEGPIRDDYARYATDIAGAARHLLTLIDDLATIRKIDGDDFSVARERVSLTDVADRTAKLMAIRAAALDVTIAPPGAAKLVDGTAPDWPVAGEQRRVFQILLNLVGNAIRYGARPGTVTMSIGGDDATASITISDDGPGVPAPLRPRLFTRFDRLGRTDSGGSGLGLYISRRLARAMGGDLTYTEAATGGAAFTLSLPVWHDPADQRWSSGT